MEEHHSGSRYRLGYRPDIEGLRAVAVLLVVAAHAGMPGLAGGFVGVDVFFVLSGYLITGLLVQEIHGTGTVALARFYARRLLRLMPALLLTVVVTAVLGWLLLPPTEQPPQALAAAAAALWVSNLHFAVQRMDYFSPGSESNLFLHTWSLGVEEQFYLLWPLLLMLAFWIWRSTQRHPQSRVLATTLWLVLAASFMLGLYWLDSPQPAFAFYMMPARAWQFALGALVFLYFGAPGFRSGENRGPAMDAPWFTGWAGLGMIVAAALVLDKHTYYPGLWALLPSVGAALVLIPSRRSSFAGADRLLALPPMQAIGRMSYSWYLWHWPVLLLGATLVNIHNGWNRSGLALLSLAIAAASWRWFETPLRNRRQLIARPRLAILSSVAVMIFIASLALLWENSSAARQHPHQSARADAPVIYRMDCDDWYRSAEVKTCAFGAEDAPRTAVVMGDSIGLQWFPAYAGVFSAPDWRLLVITKSACPMVDIPVFYSRIGRMYTECDEWRNAALDTIASLSPDIVVLGSSGSYDYTSAQWEQGTRQVLQRLENNADQIRIVRPTPLLTFNGPACLEPRSRFHVWLSGEPSCTATASSTRSQEVLDALEAAAAPFSNASIIDMTDEVCPDGTCHAWLNGHVTFRDSQHLTASFAGSLTEKLAHRMHIPPSPREAEE